MTNCNRSNAAIAPKLMKQVQVKLKEVQQLFPITTNSLIIDKNGEIIVETSQNNLGQKELSNTIHQLKTYAISFVSTLQEKDDCSHIHIRGEKNMFSFYIVRDSVSKYREEPLFNLVILAFFTQMDFEAGKKFNFQQADDKVKLICQDLLHLLANTKI
ncbi:hypothetical protein DDB_G0288727 [Dictyostelium discoideum AX4]|uniref:Roadblock/LAMTOR2 domain-containing protein n=1 Tax=Dictyostelium discoideum TaxID=44689 RepID=Q54II6_DICDI|nr:hypothetical protein DDB_G0288727 [Dictyostelium discoideum AX4]EAL63095.1 hypothetical protein DDB_G0288727 [Dictyostelium discoideum AX4]|eukprot:XP_636600.1 hypothetical protein DDB_G0288727 [Dictyostelium discoideum AX4]